MLSKFLRYARDILNFPTSTPPTDLEAEAKSSTRAMVTTRRQSGSNSDPATEVSPALESLAQDAHSVSSKKRRRAQAGDGPTSRTPQHNLNPANTRKRRKLPVREKDEQHFERHAHIAVEIPVRDIRQDDAPMWTTSNQIRSKGKLALAEDTSLDSHVRGAHSQIDEEVENDQMLCTVAQKAVDEAIGSQEISEETVAEQEGSRRVRSRSKKNNSTPVPVKAAIGSNAIKPKHKRFDSEEPIAEELGPVGEEEARIEEEEEGSDDDAAPEVVAADDAQKKAKLAARSAIKAVEEQGAIIRKKRKERDAQLKEQAKAASKKRKQAGDIEEEGAASAPVDTNESLDANQARDDPSGNSLDAFKDIMDSSKPRAVINKHKIPEFLPAEYLEDDLVEDQMSPPSIKQTVVRKSKKTKFTDPAPKKPKDRTKGSTIYRVLEAPSDGLLAPKVAINALSVKQAWLNGQRGAGGSKVVKGGFFKRK